MARPLRLELAGGVYHVTARGNARGRIVEDDADRRAFLDGLDRACSRFGWLCLAYCLMDNHFHLLLETPKPNLARGMRQLNGTYAQTFNRRHGRVGHLLQGRYGALLIERGEHLLAVVRYVVRNPIRAGLCSQPTDWRWSSYRATLGLAPPGPLALDSLLTHFGQTRTRARERYREFVDQEGGEPAASGLVILGSDRFLRDVTDDLEPSTEVPRRHWQPYRPPLIKLLQTHVRDEAIAIAYREYAYHMREIAEALGCHYATISRRLRAYEERELLDCKT